MSDPYTDTEFPIKTADFPSRNVFWIAGGECAVCKALTLCLHADSSGDEYGAVLICQPCIFRAFQNLQIGAIAALRSRIEDAADDKANIQAVIELNAELNSELSKARNESERTTPLPGLAEK